MTKDKELSNLVNDLRVEKNKLKRELAEEKEKTKKLEQEIKDLNCKSKEVESHLEKYKEMMEEAVSDCQTIVSIASREENEEKKKEYQKFEETYKAEIIKVDKTINNLK